MPVTHFSLRWPDARETRCYSPSSVVADYLQPGKSYPLTEFMPLVREALGTASERVRMKYGFACSQAMDQLAEIEAIAQGHAAQTNAQVLVTAIE